MVKRICIIYPDASLAVMSGQEGPVVAVNTARKLCRGYNRQAPDKKDHAQFGEIEVDLMSFKELL
jgi:hypothetical protein